MQTGRTAERGYTTYTCSCGDSYDDDYTDPLNHPETVTLDGFDPDCTNTGLTDGLQCAICGEVLQEQEEIPVLGHQPEYVPEVPATESSTSVTEGYVCSVCGEVLEGFDEIPMLEPAPVEEPTPAVEPQDIAPAQNNQTPVTTGTDTPKTDEATGETAMAACMILNITALAMVPLDVLANYITNRGWKYEFYKSTVLFSCC